MVEIVHGVSLEEVVIPVVCFTVCTAFQAWEFVGNHHDDPARARSLFKSVRAGWVKDQYMKGTAACNTTRDYIKSAVFMANTAITLATFTVGYAGSVYTNCLDGNDCTATGWFFVVKLGVLAVTLLTIFFVFTQCTRFAVHFSFCINTRELDGVPMPQGILVNVLEHSHQYFSLGIRLYFGTIPVFAWIFTPWALLAVTPVYVYMVRGLENAGFVQAEMEEVARLRADLRGSSVVTSTGEAFEEGADKKL